MSRRNLFAAALLAALSFPAQAATISFDFTFSGQPPAGEPPWLSAVLTDVGSQKVRLALSASGLTAPESVKGVYFNLDPTLSLTSLAFSYQNGSPGAQAISTEASANKFKADGDGFYDILFSFSSGSGFDAGESVTYDMTYGGGGSFGAASFQYQSEPGGGEGTYYAAAHIQNTPNGSAPDGSAWVGAQSFVAQDVTPVPLPAPLGLLAAGLAILGLQRRISSPR